LYGIPHVSSPKIVRSDARRISFALEDVVVGVVDNPACERMLAEFIGEHPDSMDRGHRSLAT
jgi:hypothetical protein